jgi:ADP-heptose:LPS heptosyltransferase
MSRLAGRLHIFARALPRLVVERFRCKPSRITRVLIAHHLLLGDTLLLTPLLAKLRTRYPDAQVVLTCPKPIVPLYAGRPFGVEPLAFDPRDHHSVAKVLRSGPYDLGIVAGDNRHSWLALAAGCRWIIGHGGDSPAWKNWPLNEKGCYPAAPAAWADVVAQLIDGPAPSRYRPAYWPVPASNPLPDAEKLSRPYVVLHPGASGAVKRWSPDNWHALAQAVESLGFTPVFSGGPTEVALVRAIDPHGKYPSYAGRLDLGQLWHLLAGARALVCLDTGVAHLARLIGVPTVALFGPGSAAIHGPGDYWRDAPFVPLTIVDMPCRNQPRIFRHRVAWARRCDRNVATCVAWEGEQAKCMAMLSVPMVLDALHGVLSK